MSARSGRGAVPKSLSILELQRTHEHATEWLPALGLRQMIKARWTGIICPLLGHKRIPLTQYQDGFFLWACERCGYRDWEFASRKHSDVAPQNEWRAGRPATSVEVVVR